MPNKNVTVLHDLEMPNALKIANNCCFDNISGYRRYKIMSFDAPQQGEVTGQTARNRLRRLSCVVEHSGTDISHTLSSFIFQT